MNSCMSDKFVITTQTREPHPSTVFLLSILLLEKKSSRLFCLFLGFFCLSLFDCFSLLLLLFFFRPVPVSHHDNIFYLYLLQTKRWAFLRDIIYLLPEWLISLCILATYLTLTFALPVPGCPTYLFLIDL